MPEDYTERVQQGITGAYELMHDGASPATHALAAVIYRDTFDVMKAHSPATNATLLVALAEGFASISAALIVQWVDATADHTQRQGALAQATDSVALLFNMLLNTASHDLGLDREKEQTIALVDELIHPPSTQTGDD